MEQRNRTEGTIPFLDVLVIRSPTGIQTTVPYTGNPRPQTDTLTSPQPKHGGRKILPSQH